MLERVLNKLGFVKRIDYLAVIKINAELREQNERILKALSASEKTKAEANRRAIKLAKELNELKLKYVRRVKGKKAYIK